MVLSRRDTGLMDNRVPNCIPPLLSEGGAERLPGGGVGVRDYQEGERLRLRVLKRVRGAGLRPLFLPYSEARVGTGTWRCS